MIEKKDIDIAVCYHKNFLLFENECLTPIQCGRDCNDIQLPILGDNIGDNISYKNYHYAELTAAYWLWKNSKSKIKGLVHYRRLLDLSGNYSDKDYYTVNLEDINNSNEILKNLCYKKEHIENILNKYDIIARKKDNLKDWSNYTIYTHYKASHIIEHMDLTTKVIKKYYPEYYNYWKNFLNQSTSYFTNIMIMRAENYDKLCEWVFDVLYKVEKQINLYDNRLAPNSDNSRWAGFLGERLIGFYLTYQNIIGKKIKEFPVMIIEEGGKKWDKINTFDFSNNENKKAIEIPTENNTPIISVCVAVDNKSSYLAQCLDSIINSTLKNIEILCINDSSTDNSLDILQQYSKLDNRIKIISKENEGLGSVRNLSVQEAKGKYIFFMDSDDYMDKTFLANMVENAEFYNSEIVISNHRTVEDKSLKTIYKQNLMHTLHNKIPLNIKNCPDLILVSSHICDKIFRRDFVQNIQFLQNENNECLYFWYQCLINASRISIHRNIEYNCRINSQSIKTQPDNIMQTLYMLEKIYNEIETYHNEYNTYFSLYVYLTLRRILIRANKTLDENIVLRNAFLKETKSLLTHLKLDNNVLNKLSWYSLNKKNIKKFKKFKSFKDMKICFNNNYSYNSTFYSIIFNYLKYTLKYTRKRRKYLKKFLINLQELPEYFIIRLFGIPFEFNKYDFVLILLGHHYIEPNKYIKFNL